ncbi:MAG: alpha/beta hydrolase-fold protein [Planctomycetaceae bacterium]
MTPGILAAIVAISTISTAAFSPAQQRGREIKWVNADIADMKGLTHHVLNSQSMGHEVGYVVWTPPEYDQDRQTRYPVVYFLHGAGGSEKSDSAGFSSRVSAAIRSGKFPSAICVFPNGGMSGYRNDVESMIVDELIPRIDRSYRTLPAAESRVVCGFSMGGAGSVHLSLRHPDLFCAAGSWGGALSFRGRADESPLLEIAKENAGQLKTHQYALLTINGDQDRPDAFQPLKEILTSQGISHHVITLKDTNHNLGKYYELGGDAMLEFLAERLSADEPFQIEESVIAQSHGELHWSQSRPALIPGNPQSGDCDDTGDRAARFPWLPQRVFYRNDGRCEILERTEGDHQSSPSLDAGRSRPGHRRRLPSMARCHRCRAGSWKDLWL